MDEEKMQHRLPPEAEGEEIDPADEQEQVAKTRECEYRLLRVGIGSI